MLPDQSATYMNDHGSALPTIDVVALISNFNLKNKWFRCGLGRGLWLGLGPDLELGLGLGLCEVLSCA